MLPEEMTAPYSSWRMALMISTTAVAVVVTPAESVAVTTIVFGPSSTT